MTRRVKGTIHWVSAAHAQDAEVRLYDRLFASEDPGAGDRDPITDLNPESLQVLTRCKVEPMLARCEPGTHIQFERNGYFVIDRDSRAGPPGVQPHGHVEGQLAADRRQAVMQDLPSVFPGPLP